MRTIRGILIMFINISCGGVIGNIEKYPLENVTYDEVSEALGRVYSKYPELKKTDTTKYGMNDGKDFYFILGIEISDTYLNAMLSITAEEITVPSICR